MSAFKKLDRKDSYTSVYNSQKKWKVRESEFDSLGIKFLNSTNNQYIQNSINHLYYSQFNENSSNRFFFENYLQSSFSGLDSRNFITEEFTVINIPSKIIGTHIIPGSLTIKINPDFIFTLYVETDYIDQNFNTGPDSQYVAQDGYNEAFISIQDPNNSNNSIVINQMLDDGEGNLVVINGNQDKVIVGNIIYTHGIIILTNNKVAQAINQQDAFELEWKSNLPIYTKNYVCKIKNSELNHTLNRTTFSTDLGEVSQNINTKSFTPYFTTIGLYNDVNELIAVAKTSQPIPKSKFTNMTVNIKIDMPFGVDGILEPFNKLEGSG